MSSTDKPGTGTVDNQSPTQTRPPERPPPRQPEDPRSRTQYNNDTYAKPPVQRRHDNASSSSAQRPDGASRSSDSTRTGKDTNAKAAPAANDRTTQRRPERSTAADASTPARQQTPKDTRTTAEYNRDTHAGPPVHRYKDSNPGTRPEGNSRAPAGAQTADQPAARDTTAPRTARNTERAGPTPTDNHGPTGRQTPGDTRSTPEYRSDILSGPPVHRNHDNTTRPPDHTTSTTERRSPEAHPEPRRQDTPAPVGNGAQQATPDARQDPAGHGLKAMPDHHGDKAPPDTAGREQREAAPTEAHTPTQEKTALSLPLQDGSDAQITVVHLPPEARTVGDDTPTGVGIKPTGDQLLEMEDAESPKDQYFRDLFERSDDINDASVHATETVEAFRHHDDGPVPHPSAYTGHAVLETPPAEGAPMQDMIGGIVTMSVAAAVGFRHLLTNRKKELEP